MKCRYCQEETYITFDSSNIPIKIKFKCGTIIDIDFNIKQSRSCKARCNNKKKPYKKAKRNKNFDYQTIITNPSNRFSENLDHNATYGVINESLIDNEKEKDSFNTG